MSTYHRPLDAYEEYIVRKRGTEADTLADTAEFKLRRPPTFSETVHPGEMDHSGGQMVARWALFLLYAVPLSILTLPTIIFPLLAIGEMWPIPRRVSISRDEQNRRTIKGTLDAQWHGGRLNPAPFDH